MRYVIRPIRRQPWAYRARFVYGNSNPIPAGTSFPGRYMHQRLWRFVTVRR